MEGKEGRSERKSAAEKLKTILDSEGYDLTAMDYDAIQTDKPPRSTLRRWFGTWESLKEKVKGYTTETDIAEWGTKEEEEKIEEAREVVPDMEANIGLVHENEALKRKLKQQQDMTEIVIEQMARRFALCNFRPAKIPKPEKKKYDHAFHAMKSDTHIGELVDPLWVQGLGEYNIDIFKKYMNVWLEKILIFREQDKTSHGLNKLVMHMLGDFVTGETIYKGQAFMIDAPTIEQLVVCTEIYTQVLLVLAREFNTIEIYCVQGNHGRSTKKGESHPRTNFDAIFYNMLKLALARQSNIQIFISDSPTMIVQHGVFNFALNHNDNVNSWMGLPFYGLNRKASRMTDLYSMIIHYKLGGHFHQSANLNEDEILLNGSMVGGSELSINQMNISSRPSQKIFYFDENRGIQAVTNLILAERKVLGLKNNNVYTPHNTLANKLIGV